MPLILFYTSLPAAEARPLARPFGAFPEGVVPHGKANVPCPRMLSDSCCIIAFVTRLLALFLIVAPVVFAEEGFTSLFNGTDLRGWLLVHKGKSAKGYQVRDGMIVCPRDGGGNLLTVKEFSNFIFRFEFRLEPGGNNGVAIRAPISGDVAYSGIEIQILDHDHPKYRGWLKPWQRHGAVYNIVPPIRDALKPAGEWNSEEILVMGPHIRVTLNGTLITDADLSQVTDPKIIAKHPGMRRTKGRVGFLGHGSLVEFRNIRIKELPDRSNPQVCELDIGESCEVWDAEALPRTVKLVSVRERTEPYFEAAASRVVQAVTGADLEIEIDGRPFTLQAGPYRMPAELGGLQILVSGLRGASGGIVPDPLEKAVRLEIQDASLPFYARKRLAFPVANERWAASSYRNTFLGLVPGQPRLYYHRGEDFGHVPDRDDVVTMTDGSVEKIPGPHGDGASNSVIVRDPKGVAIRYAHMNSLYLRRDLRPGDEVRCGERLGRTGNTWKGLPSEDPHLHVEAKLNGTFLNSFPLLVEAYRRAHPDEILAVAGGVRYVYAGDEIELDASATLPPEGRQIVSWEWLFTDGSRADGIRVRRRYERPGAYTEALHVIDSKGAEAWAFVQVYVLPRQARRQPPYAILNYHPVRGVWAGTPLELRSLVRGMKNARVDFGDGTVVEWKQRLLHRYRRPGTYLITLSGEDTGAGPGIFRTAVVVE